MLHLNLSGYNVYALGHIIKSDTIFKTDDNEFEKLSMDINKIISLGDMFLILNKAFTVLTYDESIDDINTPEKYEHIKLSNIKGNGIIILDNIKYSTAEFIDIYNKKIILNTQILAVEKIISCDIGVN
jgi:hypothetical protein